MIWRSRAFPGSMPPRPTIPRTIPASVRDDAMANFGPNLSNMAAKFQAKPEGLKWLSNWINARPRNIIPRA